MLSPKSYQGPGFNLQSIGGKSNPLDGARSIAVWPSRPILVQSITNSNTLGSSKTVSFTTRPSPGNLLVAFVGTQSGWQAPQSIPSGWTDLDPKVVADPSCSVMTKIALPEETNSYNFNISNAGRINVHLFEFYNATGVEILRSTRLTDNATNDNTYLTKGHFFTCSGKSGNGSLTLQILGDEISTTHSQDVCWLTSCIKPAQKKQKRFVTSRHIISANTPAADRSIDCVIY